VSEKVFFIKMPEIGVITPISDALYLPQNTLKSGITWILTLGQARPTPAFSDTLSARHRLKCALPGCGIIE
jgi:hypothetical protein